jgi:hypothetical protein
MAGLDFAARKALLKFSRSRFAVFGAKTYAR